MSTVESMLQAGPLAWQPLPTRPRVRVVAWLVPAVLIAALFFGTRTLPYYAIAPGVARQVNDLIRVPPDKLHRPKGQVLLATVQLGPVRGFDFVRDWFQPDIEVVSEKQILGSTPRSQLDVRNQQDMTDSKTLAIVAALRRLGYPVAEHGTGAVVNFVEDGTPAAGRLESGDVITAVDGHPIETSDALVTAIRKHHPGDTLIVQAEGAKGSSRKTESLMLGSRDAVPRTCAEQAAARSAPAQKRPQRAFLGINTVTRSEQFDPPPFPVTIDSAGIGGPSAGLAFTLALIDELTPSELTGRHRIAATGTIEPDGTVGPVGGVPQKTIAVRKAGAEAFLVPCQEYRDAVAHAGKRLQVIAVASLDEALSALGHLGGNLRALPPSPQRPGG